MYQQFFGLAKKPFELQPDPDFVYMSPAHDDVYTALRYAVEACQGFVVITGEIGSGKTTLLHLLLRRVPEHLKVAFLQNPNVAPVQFLRQICREFALIDPGRRADKQRLLELLCQHLVVREGTPRGLVLIVDEAQNLPRSTLEEIRMLSNVAAGTPGAIQIQIILVGQPEFRDQLRQPGLEQLVQRVTVHCHLDKLSAEDVACYVRHRLQVAGGRDPMPFDDEALAELYRCTGGVPRLLNILCDTALVFAFADGRVRIGRDVIREVVASRAEGGLLAAVGPEPAAPSVPAGVPAAPSGLEERVEALEARVRGLEGSREGAVAGAGGHPLRAFGGPPPRLGAERGARPPRGAAQSGGPEAVVVPVRGRSSDGTRGRGAPGDPPVPSTREAGPIPSFGNRTLRSLLHGFWSRLGKVAALSTQGSTPAASPSAVTPPPPKS